jgi:hypothetical protein
MASENLATDELFSFCREKPGATHSDAKSIPDPTRSPDCQSREIGDMPYFDVIVGLSLFVIANMTDVAKPPASNSMMLAAVGMEDRLALL